EVGAAHDPTGAQPCRKQCSQHFGRLLRFGPMPRAVTLFRLQRSPKSQMRRMQQAAVRRELALSGRVARSAGRPLRKWQTISAIIANTNFTVFSDVAGA